MLTEFARLHSAGEIDHEKPAGDDGDADEVFAAEAAGAWWVDEETTDFGHGGTGALWGGPMQSQGGLFDGPPSASSSGGGGFDESKHPRDDKGEFTTGEHHVGRYGMTSIPAGSTAAQAAKSIGDDLHMDRLPYAQHGHTVMRQLFPHLDDPTVAGMLRDAKLEAQWTPPALPKIPDKPRKAIDQSKVWKPRPATAADAKIGKQYHDVGATGAMFGNEHQRWPIGSEEHAEALERDAAAARQQFWGAWDDSKHPRGQPANSGQFARVEGDHTVRATRDAKGTAGGDVAPAAAPEARGKGTRAGGGGGGKPAGIRNVLDLRARMAANKAAGPMGAAAAKLTSVEVIPEIKYDSVEWGNPKPTQKLADNSFAALAQAAAAAKPQYDGFVGGVMASALSATPLSGNDDQRVAELASGKPGARVILAPIKGELRTTEKAAADYKLPDGTPNFARVCDMVRGTLAFDTPDDVTNAYKELARRAVASGFRIVQMKNKFGDPTPVGYRDMNLLLQTPDGHLSELQLNVKSMLVAKHHAHPLYEQWRTIADKCTKEGRDATPQESSAMHALEEKQRAIYEPAWQKATAAWTPQAAAPQPGTGPAPR